LSDKKFRKFEMKTVLSNFKKRMTQKSCICCDLQLSCNLLSILIKTFPDSGWDSGKKKMKKSFNLPKSVKYMLFLIYLCTNLVHYVSVYYVHIIPNSSFTWNQNLSGHECVLLSALMCLWRHSIVLSTYAHDVLVLCEILMYNEPVNIVYI